MTALAIVFWVSAGLVLYAHAGYFLLLSLIGRVAPAARGGAPSGRPPSVSVIVAAYAEADVIAGRVANLRELDYPAERLEVIVACDGSPDATAAAGARGRRRRRARAPARRQDPRAGRGRAALRGRDRGVLGRQRALGGRSARRLVAPFADPRVGYVCGDVAFVNERGTNQEGLYWRYEMALRALESRVRSVTGGNGAIYATRRESYLIVDPIMGHDLSFPFNMVKRGWRAVYASDAHASEKMVPTIEGEFARKRRMMSHMWPIVLRGGMLSPRGYDPLYALMIFSHRIVRYLTPFLHVIALGTSIALIGQGWVYVAAVAIQVAILLAALAAGAIRARPLLIARYYVLTTASLAAGLWDWLQHGTAAGWEPAEGTR